MRSDVRNNPLRSMGRYWLTMADSSAFTLVSTAIAVADELRRDLADQAGLPTRQKSSKSIIVIINKKKKKQ